MEAPTFPRFDFANILFAGPCNARCPYCIGRQIDPGLSVNNLDVFPLAGLDMWIDRVRQYGIREVVFSGTTTDPQLYRHEARLLACLRQRLPPETRYALHTNGRLALRKMEVFNQYDRVCISFPAFEPQIYQRMMGVPGPPDLAEILRQARLPVKISCVVNDDNAWQIWPFLVRCADLGIRRLVLRKLYGERRSWDMLLPPAPVGLVQQDAYRGNPVYDFHGMQVTLWNFDAAESTSINLFSTGVISENYLLAQAVHKD